MVEEGNEIVIDEGFFRLKLRFYLDEEEDLWCLRFREIFELIRKFGLNEAFWG